MKLYNFVVHFKLMSSRRQSNKKKQSGNKKILQSKNLPLFKVIDPVIQSFIIILFFYTLDMGSSVQKIFYLLFGYQTLSLLINYFLKSANLLNKERLFFFFSEIIFVILFILSKRLPEKLIQIDPGTRNDSFPLILIIRMAVATVIAFWYFYICFREAKDLLKTERSNFGDY